MALLAQRLVQYFLKFTTKDRHEEPSASLRDFRSKTSGFLSQIMLKAGSERMPMASWFKECFDMMHAANTAFADLVAEIEYPMSQWGAAAAHHYLTYTLSMMDVLNSITSSISHLNMVKLSMLHGVTLVENSPNSAAKYLKKVDRGNLGTYYDVEKCARIDMRAGTEQKEGVILEAVMGLKKIGFFALGLVLSGLWNDLVPRGLGLNEEGVRELKGRLEVMENAIKGVEKEANYLFSEVLAARNKMLDNVRSQVQ